jgi:hypothetical protein
MPEQTAMWAFLFWRWNSLMAEIKETKAQRVERLKRAKNYKRFQLSSTVASGSSSS